MPGLVKGLLFPLGFCRSAGDRGTLRISAAGVKHIGACIGQFMFKNTGGLLVPCLRRGNAGISLGSELRFCKRA